MPPGDANPLARAEAQLRAGEEPAALRILLANAEQPDCAVRLREWAVAERQLQLLPQALQPLLAAGGPEADVSRAVQAQASGDPAAALALLRAVLGAHPELASAQHHAGRALHNLGRRPEALAALRLAVRLDHDYSDAWFSLAHALRAAGRMDEAISAYRTALARRPGFRAALLALGVTLVAAERADEAMAPLDRLLELDPDNGEALAYRGLCLHVLGRLAEAEASQQRVLARDPNHPLAHFYLGCLLNERLDSSRAREHLLQALQGMPDDAEVLAELAGLSEQLSALDEAAAYVARGLAAAPGHAGLRLEAARLARRAGRLAEARSHLQGLDAATLPQRQAQQYWFERALLLDRSGEPGPALEALARGHALAAASPRRRSVDAGAFPRQLDAIEQWLAAGAPGGAPQAGDPPAPGTPRLAFLVGFPRSGTTLLDTMLDAHPEVASIEERPTIEPVAEALLADGSGWPQGMARLAASDLEAGRARYLATVGRLLPQGFAGTVLDKLPLRLLLVPLLHRLFPQAALLFAVRHPFDVVLSNVMQQYRPNEAFVHFDSIEAAARSYDRVMRIWRGMREQLPLPVHEVRYERLVSEPEAELASACAALGVDLQPGMLDTGARLGGRGRIETNSYQQVAEPLYTRAVGRWRAYRPWLEPVLPLLAPHATWLGYSLD